MRTKRPRSVCALRNGAFGACEISSSRADSIEANNCSTMCCRYWSIVACGRAAILMEMSMRVFVASGSVITAYSVPG